MSTMNASETGVRKTGGRLSQALTRLLMKSATVSAVETLGGDFRLITLEGPALRGVNWVPGQKAQIAMGSAFLKRTYTPMDWDAEAGRTRILGYVHGTGPGSAWLRDLTPGDTCDIFGPRGSIDASGVSGPLAIFGDETAIGLGYALTAQNPSAGHSCYFEVSDRQGTAEVIDRIGLGAASLFARQGGEAHVSELEAALLALADTDVNFVLSGKAGTIQSLRRALKQLGVPSKRIMTKAYWAPGKTGMD